MFEKLGGGTPHILFEGIWLDIQTRGGHRTEKMYIGRGDTAHTFLNRGTMGVGTPHNIVRKVSK